jgi:hypothetical protein
MPSVPRNGRSGSGGWRVGRAGVLGDFAGPGRRVSGVGVRQAHLVAANIRALIAADTGDSGGADLAPYQPSQPVIIVPIGPDGGSGQLPGSDDLATPERVAQAKGRDMMVGRFTELLGITAPAGE